MPSKGPMCEQLEFQKSEGAGNLFKEIMVDSFPNLARDLDIHVHETYRSLIEINLRALLHSFVCGYPVFPTLFVEETTVSH